MSSFLSRLGAGSARHKWIVIAAWLIILVAGLVLSARLSQPLSDSFSIPGLQSVNTLHTINSEFDAGGTATGRVVFAAPEGEKLTAADRETVGQLATALADVDGVKSAPDPFASAQPSVSSDGRVGYITVTLTGENPDKATTTGIADAISHASSAQLQVAATSTLDAAHGGGGTPIVGIVLAFVILLMTFGTFLAAGMPLVTAIIGLLISMTGIYAATSFVDLSSVAPALAVLLGLAVGIDYALFIVNRHRRQLLDGMEVRASIARAVGTAGTAVVFAGATVVVALAGLAIMGVDFVSQMGLAGAFAVLIAILVSITLTPALLSLAGMRLLSRRARRRMDEHASTQDETAPRRGLASRWVGLVARHPLVVGAGALALLIVLALPVLGLRLGLPNDSTQPASTNQRQAADLLADGFGDGINAPLLVLATYPDPASPSDVQHLTSALSDVTNVAHVIPTGMHDHEVLVTIIPTSGPTDEATEQLVTTLRDSAAVSDLSGSPSLSVSGQTAVAIDISARLAQSMPIYLLVVVGFAFLLLLLVFRSILIPIKATIGFLLSLGAALGVTVAVFQWGWLGHVFRVDPAAPLLSFLPVLVIGVLFGLSMDYEMFLVTGMREEHARGASARDAVLTGFAHGARVVVAAALIMIGVFGNGAFTSSALTRPIAFALAIGILVDAFVVRMTLVPAVMILFGRASWWLPRWLDRIVPNVDIEGSALPMPDESSAPARRVPEPV